MAGVKPLLETIGALMPKGIKAWHASPHDFDKVDLSKIGTGQGAASYGPGFYAAESPAVSGVGGEYWNEFSRSMQRGSGAENSHAIDILQKHKGDRGAALADVEQALTGTTNYPRVHMERVRDLLASDKQVGPRVYELNLKADPRSFLQWDEALAAQPHITKKLPMLLDAAKDEAYSRYLSATNKPRADDLWEMTKAPEYATGEFAYRGLANRMKGEEWSEKGPGRVMQTFQLADVPGIRYLDAKSRSLADYSGAQQKDLDEVIAQITKYRAEGNNLRAAELDQHRA